MKLVLDIAFSILIRKATERYYVRKAGRRKIRIREPFEDQIGKITPEFIAAYWKALDILAGKAPAAPALPREKTFNWLVDKYFKSEEFKRFDHLTQADKRSVLNRFCETAGSLPYAALRIEDVEASRDRACSNARCGRQTCEISS